MIAARNEADVIEAVRGARERRRTLEIVGAGTKRAFGRVMQCDDVLEVSAISGIVKYEPAELILTCLPGTPVAEIDALLAAKNQRLGFEPADWGPLLGAPAGRATIGGVLSADASGSAAIRYGRARDSLLGYRAVNGFGEAYKAGGKVVKNVTGFDLPKLMCGAMGTLGVLTEVTLRVFPKPERAVCFAVRNVARVLGHEVLRRIWKSPLEATALAYVPEVSASAFPEMGDIGAGAAVIRLEGSSAVLSEKLAMMRELFSGEDVSELGEANVVLARISGGAITGDTEWDVYRRYTQPSQRDDYEDAPREAAHRAPWVSDWAGGMIWRTSTPGQPNAASILVRASEETRKRADVFPPEPPARAALTKAVKAAFDPLGIFNPGRMWDGV